MKLTTQGCQGSLNYACCLWTDNLHTKYTPRNAKCPAIYWNNQQMANLSVENYKYMEHRLISTCNNAQTFVSEPINFCKCLLATQNKNWNWIAETSMTYGHTASEMMQYKSIQLTVIFSTAIITPDNFLGTIDFQVTTQTTEMQCN